MKRLRLFVLTLGISLGTTIYAYAALPYTNEQGLLVMGDKAYSVSYIQSLNDTDIKSLNDRMQNYSNVYYVHNTSSSNTPQESVDDMLNTSMHYGSENSIYYGTGKSNITYIGVNGQQTYVYDASTGQYNVQALTATAHITVNNQTDSIWTLNVNISSSDIKGLDDYTPVYFKLEHSPDIVALGGNIDCLINKQNPETVYILSADKKIIAWGQIDTTNTYGMQYSRPFSLYMQSYGNGNVIGNIDNNGYVGNDDTWIYYSNTADGGKLYRTKFDGMENEQISNDQANYINVVGDTIYYSNYSDGGKIYKVKTDGTGRTKLCDDVASYLTVSGNYIYFSNHAYSSGLTGGRLCRVSINGGTSQVLTNDNVAYINVESDTVYYTNLSDNKYLYSINTDGLCKVKISSDSSGGASFPVIYGDYIYYLNFNDSGKIYKIGKDGSSPTKVSDSSAKSLNISGDTIFYSNYSDGNKLYKMNVDGTQNVGPLVKDSVEFINIAGSNIYYTKSGKLSVATLNSDNTTYKVTAITKPQLPDKVSKVTNITDNVLSSDAVSSYPFPDRVTAIMNNNVMKEIVVNWDKTKSVKKGNSYTYTGTLVGYGTKVTLTLTVTASQSISPSNVNITNNAGNNDTIVVSGLKAGDIINVYSASNAQQPMVSPVTVSAGSTSISMNVTLNPTGGSVWVTVTSATAGSTESARVEVQYPGESVINNTFTYTATNNVGPTDTLNLVFNSSYTPQAGDIIRIYTDYGMQSQLGTDYKVKNSSNNITISSLDFGAVGGKYYVALQSVGKSQSQPSEIDVAPSQNYNDVTATINNLNSSASSLYFYGILNTLPSNNYYDGTNNIEVIKDNIKFPVSDNNGQVVIQWSSSDSNIIESSSGLVHRPTTDKTLTLTATAKEGDASKSCSFTVKVPSVSDSEAVALDSSLTYLQGILGYSAGDTAGSVTGNITLPLKGQNNTDISWSTPSGSPITISGAVSGATSVVGNVARPGHGQPDAVTTLTAVISKGGAAPVTVTINVTVKALSGSLEDLYAAQNVIKSHDGQAFSDGNDVAALVTDSSIDSQTGISIVWQPGDTSLFNIEKDMYGNTTGRVMAIGTSYTKGPKQTTLKATLSKAGQSAQVTINVTVDNVPATDSEYVTAVANAMSANNLLLGQATWNNITNTYILKYSASPISIYLPYSSNGYGKHPLGNAGYDQYLLSVSPLIPGQAAGQADAAATVTWSASTGSGIVTMPTAGSDSASVTGTGPITLTATITRGSSIAKKVFYINVN